MAKNISGKSVFIVGDINITMLNKCDEVVTLWLGLLLYLCVTLVNVMDVVS